MKEVKTISIDKNLLEAVDAKVKSSVFFDRSSYFSYLAEKDIHKKRIKKTDIIMVIILLELALLNMILLFLL